MITPTFNPCIITGACLIFQGKEICIRGDLFLQGNQFIFNGCFGGTDVEPAWEDFHTTLRDSARTLILGAGSHYFQRRAVFVIPLESLSFEKEVFDYFKDGLEGTNYTYSAHTKKLTLN